MRTKRSCVLVRDLGRGACVFVLVDGLRLRTKSNVPATELRTKMGRRLLRALHAVRNSLVRVAHGGGAASLRPC